MSEQFNKYYNVRIKLRNDSWANWRTKEETFIPYEGEVIIYDILNEADAAAIEMPPVSYQLIKIGDGIKTLKELPFINEMSGAINITTGKTNGTISVAGNEIYVKGLDDEDIMCFQEKSLYLLASDATNQYNELNDKINTNSGAIKDEGDIRKQAIENLQTQINSLSGESEGISLSSLQSSLNAETTARINGQTALEDAVDIIATNYVNEDNNLNKKITELDGQLKNLIDVETEARKSQDEKHSDDIQKHQTSIENIEEEIGEIERNYVVSLTSNADKTQYTFSQKGEVFGTVDVPLECYLTDGRIVRSGKQAELQLNVKNIAAPVLIDASFLIDTYTHEINASQIQVNVDENTKTIGASFVPGSITNEYIAKNTIAKDNLSGDVQKILTAAELTLGDSIGSIDTKFDELVEYIDNKTSETGVIAGIYGQLENLSLSSESTFTIPQFTVDSYGRLTKAYNQICTMPTLLEINVNGIKVDKNITFYAPYDEGNEDDMLIFTSGLPTWYSSQAHISKYLIWDRIIGKPVASDNILGLIKIGYEENNKNYALKLDDNNQAYVTVPWEGVLNISTGTANGTISVNTNGTTTDVAIKGLGSAAYTDSNAYDAAGAAAAVKNELLNGAGAAYDTLKELGDLIDVNNDAIDALNTVAAGKADKNHTHNYAGSSSVGGAATSANKLNTDAGSATQPIYFSNGVPVATTYALNKTVPANAVFTDTTYSANNGIGLSGTTFYNSGVRAVSTGGSNGTITVNTNGTDKEVAVKGLGSNAYTSTAYLPLAGGTVTGVTTFSNTTASTSTTTGAVKISGGLGVAGTVYGKTIYGAVYNDYAEYRSSEKVVPGNCICDDYNGIMKKTTKRLQPACKIVSDTFGFAIGQTEKCKTPTAVCGRVLAIPYEERETYSVGDCVCSGPNGTISRMTREEIVNYPDRIVGIVSEIPSYNIWGEDDIQVNGRIWIYVR